MGVTTEKRWRPRRRLKTPEVWELDEITEALRSDADMERAQHDSRIRTLRDEAADAIEALRRDLKAAQT